MSNGGIHCDCWTSHLTSEDKHILVTSFCWTPVGCTALVMASRLQPVSTEPYTLRKCGSRDARCLNLRSGGGREPVPVAGCGFPVLVRPVFAAHLQRVAPLCCNYTHVQVTHRPATLVLPHPLPSHLLTQPLNNLVENILLHRLYSHH